MCTKDSEATTAAFTCIVYHDTVANKAALTNSVYVSRHHNPMMHTNGMGNINFTLQDKSMNAML